MTSDLDGAALTALAALTAVVALACGGCSDTADLPTDQGFVACLDGAGVQAEDLDDADARRDAFSEPEALDCVVDLEGASDQEAALAGAFTYDELWPVLLDWIETRPDSAATLAGLTGELLRASAVDDDDLDRSGIAYEPAQVYEALALAAYEQANGAPPSYRSWLDDQEAQDSVSTSDPLSPASQYLNWVEDPANGDADTAEQVRDLEQVIRQGRED